MEIKLADGSTYEAVNVTGKGSYLQGAQRDTLSFAFLKDKYTLALSLIHILQLSR